jgi:hypothetical protein
MLNRDVEELVLTGVEALTGMATVSSLASMRAPHFEQLRESPDDAVPHEPHWVMV